MRPEGAFLPRPARGTWFGAEDLLIGIRETNRSAVGTERRLRVSPEPQWAELEKKELDTNETTRREARQKKAFGIRIVQHFLKENEGSPMRPGPTETP